MSGFTKKQIEYILGCVSKKDIILKTASKITFKSCNIEDVNIYKGTYTVELLNWGEIKTTLICGDYKRELIFTSFEDYQKYK